MERTLNAFFTFSRNVVGKEIDKLEQSKKQMHAGGGRCKGRGWGNISRADDGQGREIANNGLELTGEEFGTTKQFYKNVIDYNQTNLIIIE